MKLPFRELHDPEVQRNFEELELTVPFRTAASPASTLGNNGDWSLGADGHIYFKSAGSWGLVI